MRIIRVALLIYSLLAGLIIITNFAMNDFIGLCIFAPIEVFLFLMLSKIDEV